MKKKYLRSIFLVLFTIFISNIVYKIYNKNIEQLGNSILISYPKGNINFAGEIVSQMSNNGLNKRRFDKEYMINSKTLYQLFLYIKRYPLYIPYIEEKFMENNIPDDFKYLAIAESGLREKVISTAGATGIWQFMPDTAKRFNLKINKYVDERYNFEKSTEAAIEYFKILYKKFGNRTLVAASYNRGENGIQKLLKKQNVDNYYDLFMNEETSRYVFRILAIKYSLINAFKKKSIIEPMIGGSFELSKTKKIKINKIDDLLLWSKKNKQDYRSVKILNPWILGNSLPEGNWEIKILDNQI